MRSCATYCVLGLLVGLMFAADWSARAQGADVGSTPASLQTAAPDVDQKPKHRLHFPIGIDRIPDQDREAMQLPFGIGTSFFGSRENYLFGSASVSINGQPIPSQMMNLDSITVIQDSRTVLIDAWLLPFLNIYGLGGTFSGTTRNIKASMVGQDIPLPQEIPFSGTTRGFGATLAGGYKRLFFTYDWNKSWAKVDLATGSTPTVTQGPRIGVATDKPNVHTEIYVGSFKEEVSGNTFGSITFPDIGQFDYNVTVGPERAWNYVVGANVELRKHWQINVEHGFGKRTHNMLSITARF